MNKGLKVYTLIFLCLWATDCVAQSTFNQRYGEINLIDSSIFSSNNCLSVVVADSVIYATHEQRFAPGNAEVGIVGIDYEGNELYNKLYGSDDAWWLLGHQSSSYFTSDGYILETGSKDRVGGSVLYQPSVFKFDQNGDTLWTKEYQVLQNRPAYGAQIMEASNGDYVVTCVAFVDTIDWNPQIVVFRTDSNGDILWSQEYGNPNEPAEFGVSIIEDNEGGFFVGGAFQATPSSYSDNLLMKIDANGNEIWTQTYGNEFDDGTFKLAALSDGNYLMSGGLGVDDDNFIANLRKIDSDGNIIWENQYDNVSSVSAFFSAVQDWEENIVVVGQKIDSTGWRVGTMAKVNMDGDSLWMREYRLFETATIHRLLDIGIASDSSFVGAGFVLVVPPNPHVGQDVWVFKVDQHGCLEPGCQLINGLQTINIGLQNAMNVYPNPVQDQLNIQFNIPASGTFGNQKNNRLLLIDQIGKLVLENPLQSFQNNLSFSDQLDLSRFASGIYTLHWISDSGWLDSINVIKQ